MSTAPPPEALAVAMSRPQVGIERLPTRRMSNEPRESMNCKSCRKRKIKCNRLRPACEACQVFQCPCIYDAIPKKRGPKTDVLEALLKRVDGLEQRLKDKKSDGSPTAEEAPSLTSEGSPATSAPPVGVQAPISTAQSEPKPKRAAFENHRSHNSARDSATDSPEAPSEASPVVPADALLDTYFSRFHAKPYHILDEATVRQRIQLQEIPSFLVFSIYAVAARYTPHPNGYHSAIKLGEEYALRARKELDTDEPSIDALQALLFLVIAFTAAGKGKKAYMLMTNATGMAIALELHREGDLTASRTPVEREMCRRLFWTCYLLDKFMACGSKRPCLIGDQGILLRLPHWLPNTANAPIEGEFFQTGSNLQYLHGSGMKCQGSNGMLIDISRILGITNRYLAAGGVKGDSHFPWHALSNLSKIRQDLDVWASGTDDVFSSVEALFGQPDSTVLVLSKLIYHLIHCLIYRPFIPINLAELAGTGQHQSWQIEATNMCFAHANAIAELVELGKQIGTIEWPAFVGYCICTAGTVHIHGAHYNKAGSGDTGAFASSAEFLSREMQQLSELRYAWASVQHQRENLQGIYNAHAELVKSLAMNPMRYSPVFQLEDFFDRYSDIGGPGGQTFTFDTANLSLSDVALDFTFDNYNGHDLYVPRPGNLQGLESQRANLKRKGFTEGGGQRPDNEILTPAHNAAKNLPSDVGLPPLGGSQSRPALFPAGQAQQTTVMLQSPVSMISQTESLMGQQAQHGNIQNLAAATAVVANGYATAQSQQPHHSPTLPSNPFSPTYNFATPAGASNHNLHQDSGAHAGAHAYDPMFGTVPTNAYSSPAAWQGDQDDRNLAQLATSPEATSQNGSVGTGPGDEKDPFLSLLEQLADNENSQGSGTELDFFLAGGQA